MILVSSSITLNSSEPSTETPVRKFMLDLKALISGNPERKKNSQKTTPKKGVLILPSTLLCNEEFKKAEQRSGRQLTKEEKGQIISDLARAINFPGKD